MSAELPLRIEGISFTNPSEKGLPILYKYREGANQHHLRTITEGELFLSSPAGFVDKLDCNIPTNVTLMSAEERFEFVSRTIFDRFPGLRAAPPSVQRAHILHWANEGPISDPAHVQRVFEASREDFNSRFGVLCLTANAASGHMWREYSANFSGFCIGFYPQLFDDYGCGPITYVPELPVFKGNEEAGAYLINQVFLKQEQYRPEEEFRVTRFWPTPPTLEERKIRASAQQVAEIIIGHGAPASLIGLARQHLPGVTIRLARPGSDDKVVLERLI